MFSLRGHGTECMATRALRTPSVLLVNDALDERDMYARTLRACGYRVVQAATSVAAYEIAITSGTDVVTDVHLAGSMSGLELTRRLRIHTRTTTVPIIVLTSASRPQDGNVALKAGASMFLEMPVPAVVLRDQVAGLLDESASPSRYTSSQDTSSLAQRTAVAQTASWESVMDPPGSGHNARKFLGDGERHGPVNRHCPQCMDILEYRERWPILSTRMPSATSQGARERLQCESGWFCTIRAILELKSGNGQGLLQR